MNCHGDLILRILGNSRVGLEEPRKLNSRHVATPSANKRPVHPENMWLSFHLGSSLAVKIIIDSHSRINT